jgi:hypothetical protein
MYARVYRVSKITTTKLTSAANADTMAPVADNPFVDIPKML